MVGEFHGRHASCTAAAGFQNRIDEGRGVLIEIGANWIVRTDVCACCIVFGSVMRELEAG